MKNKLSNCVYALIGGSRKSLECQLNISYFICPLPFPGEKKEIRRQCIIIIHYREITYLYTSPKQVSWQLLAIPSLSSPQFHYACNEMASETSQRNIYMYIERHYWIFVINNYFLEICFYWNNKQKLWC
jgi:hypothetical protein